MITIRQQGDYSKISNYLERIKESVHLGILDRYGKEGVAALASATPKDTGLTASSWTYEINRTSNGASIIFSNTNIQNGTNIAIILQYGHATTNGGYIQGRDYINPAIQPIFDKIAEDAWKEVNSR